MSLSRDELNARQKQAIEELNAKMHEIAREVGNIGPERFAKVIRKRLNCEISLTHAGRVLGAVFSS